MIDRSFPGSLFLAFVVDSLWKEPFFLEFQKWLWSVSSSMKGLRKNGKGLEIQVSKQMKKEGNLPYGNERKSLSFSESLDRGSPPDPYTTIPFLICAERF